MPIAVLITPKKFYEIGHRLCVITYYVKKSYCIGLSVRVECEVNTGA
jgi:hypothetical protein